MYRLWLEKFFVFRPSYFFSVAGVKSCCITTLKSIYFFELALREPMYQPAKLDRIMIGYGNMHGVQKKPGMGAQTAKPPIHRVFVVQLAFLFLVSAMVAWKDSRAWQSFLLGGMIQCIPNWYFARQVFKFSGASAAQRVTQSFYRGEVSKFVLTGLGFALVFTLVENLSHPALFAGFGMMLVGHVVIVPLLNR